MIRLSYDLLVRRRKWTVHKYSQFVGQAIGHALLLTDHHQRENSIQSQARDD